MARAFANQIENRNFLSPVGFKFTLSKEPKVSFFSNSTRIPEINLGTALQPSYLKDIDTPGDKLQYGDFTLRFLDDENLENYMNLLGNPKMCIEFQYFLYFQRFLEKCLIQFVCDIRYYPN